MHDGSKCKVWNYKTLVKITGENVYDSWVWWLILGTKQRWNPSENINRWV